MTFDNVEISFWGRRESGEHFSFYFELTYLNCLLSIFLGEKATTTDDNNKYDDDHVK